MIKKESYSDGLVRVYSDEGKAIKKVGTEDLYTEAIDYEASNYTYVEVDEPVADISDSEALNIILGGDIK